MPWTSKQQAVARAVTHGWKPTGSASGFTKAFARQVISESEGGSLRKIAGKKRRKKSP